jgi:hypothetical protein
MLPLPVAQGVNDGARANVVHVALGGAQAGMAQRMLDDAKVHALIGKATCEGVSQPVRMHPLGNASPLGESLEKTADVERHKRGHSTFSLDGGEESDKICAWREQQGHR